jgi:hypothetical protein
MTCHYLFVHLMPGYSAIVQSDLWLSPGDGFKGLHFSPVWS